MMTIGVAFKKRKEIEHEQESIYRIVNAAQKRQFRHSGRGVRARSRRGGTSCPEGQSARDRAAFCIGCLYCQSHDGCALRDGVNPLLSEVQASDVLVFATPIYYYEMCGQLKTFLDRMNPLYPRENRFRDVYLLASAAEDEPSAMDGAVKGVQGWIDCFDGVRLAGVVRATGVNAAGEVRNTDAGKEAYQMGKSI